MEYFAAFGIKDLVDVFCVAFLLFYFYKLMKRTGSLNMFIGILVFIFVWIVVSQILKMQLLGVIFNKLIDVGTLAIIILFADEIRHFFRDIGTQTRTHKIFRWLIKRKDSSADAEKWQPVIRACINMSKRKEGALIVIGHDEELRDVMTLGEKIDANISQMLIENIFFKNSPLHDGAMLIINERIESAACILPVSQSDNIPKSFGLRHRAALGIAEKTNAIAIVVSEETGSITAFRRGTYVMDLSKTALEKYIILEQDS